MSEPFLAEIRIVGFNFAPRGWAFCDGQILPINQNQSLYSLLGVTYGGDGRTSFALPDLRGRTPVHMGDGYALGRKSGGGRLLRFPRRKLDLIRMVPLPQAVRRTRIKLRLRMFWVTLAKICMFHQPRLMPYPCALAPSGMPVVGWHIIICSLTQRLVMP